MKLTAGYGVADITPEVGCLLDGFIARLSSSTGIDTRLFARALYMSQGPVRSLVFSLDVMGLERNFAERFAREVGGEFGIDPGNVVAFCSHTHAGPMTETLRGVGRKDDAYLARLQGLCIAAARAAIDGAAAVHASWGEAPVAIGANRRVMTPSGMTMGINPHGPTDESVHVLRLDGGPRPIVAFIHGCHPYMIGPDLALISGDFCGHAALALERAGLHPLFINGCSGDIGPVRAFQGAVAAREEGERLSRAVVAACAGARAESDPRLWAGSLHVELPHAPVQPIEEIEKQLEAEDRTVREVDRANPRVVEKVRGAFAEWITDLRAALRKSPTLSPTPTRVSLVRVGGGAIVALPGEIFQATGRRVESLLADARPACAACFAHGYIGYVAPAEAHPEGGYEVEECHRYEALWKFHPDATDVLVDAAVRLWKESSAG